MCGVATQGNPSADDWTKTYKIETSKDNINWEFYTEDNAVKVLVFSNGFKSQVPKTKRIDSINTSEIVTSNQEEDKWCN